MCNTAPSAPLSSSAKKTNLLVPEHSEEDLQRWPTLPKVVEEMRAIGKIPIPTAATGLVLYSRAMISMLFLGYLGDLELAGGSLSIGFANITGYSVLSGLATGKEPICRQAYGAKQRELLGLTLQRTILLLFSASLPLTQQRRRRKVSRHKEDRQQQSYTKRHHKVSNDQISKPTSEKHNAG